MEETKTPVEQPDQDISYHAVEKDGEITAIWEMRGRKHIRTIDPKSAEGRRILETYKPTEK
ncbi:MAG TPA: hypothetical protein VNM72_14925 [Blastocatellia bacterium]|nr:hypothetical protein [Blastocatellia bacterium]